MLSEIRVINGVQGRAEWLDSEECLRLDFYFRTDEGIVFMHMLLPHGQELLDWDDDISPAHIEGAIATYERNKTALTEDTAYYLPNARGYIKKLPPRTLPWFTDPKEELKAFVGRAPFASLVKLSISLPKSLRPMFDEQVKPQITAWLATPEVQSYLEEVAMEMGIWWAATVGTLGTNSEGIADLLRVMLDTGQPTPGASDAARLAVAIVIAKNAMENFANNLVPFYNTDSGVRWELRKALEENGLQAMASAFPRKIGKRFEFPNPPQFTVVL